MIFPLTAKLIAVPELGWPRYVAAVERGEPLPDPIRHNGTLACASIFATGIGEALHPSATVSSTIAHALAACAAYLGVGGLLIFCAPILATRERIDAAQMERYALTSSLAVTASGVFNVIPFPLLGVLWTLLGAVMSFWSAYVGGNALLGLAGDARGRIARTVTVLGSIAPCVMTLVRLVAIP